MAATATLRFGYPDLSVKDEDRSLLNLPAPKDIVNVDVQLNDASKSTDIAQGAKGLDVQGFTYINYHSSICDGMRIMSDRNVEEVYFPETTSWLCDLLGAQKAIVINCGFRTGLAKNQENHSFVNLKGSALDQEVDKLPRDVPLVGGRGGNVFEPNRKVHIDYSLQGVKDAARYFRKDVRAMAKEALDAEDAGEQPSRYAMYSIWRPLKTVKRDPLVVCDSRTVDRSEVVETFYRSPSDICGEYMASSCMVLPPKEPERQKWYWVPQQTPEDVLIIKIGDTLTDVDDGVAQGIPHVSPVVHGTENEEARKSIEVRVMVFW